MISTSGQPAHRLTGSPAHQPTTTPLVGVVVGNWRRPDATRACLQALSAMTYRNWFAVVVDNGATDFSADALGHELPGSEYVRSAANVGFAAGANLGMSAALARGAEWIGCRNADALAEPDALDALLAAARLPLQPRVLGPKIVQHAHPERIDSIALDIDLDRGRVYLLRHAEIARPRGH